MLIELQFKKSVQDTNFIIGLNFKADKYFK